jgi:hypothetical protein
VGWISVGWVASCSRNRQDGERAHPLCAVDKDTLDIRRHGWAGFEAGIVPVAELGPAIGVVQVDDAVLGKTLSQGLEEDVWASVCDCADSWKFSLLLRAHLNSANRLKA